VARNGHAEVVALCPFLGAERTSGNSAATSESDPEGDISRSEIPQRSRSIRCPRDRVPICSGPKGIVPR
jgi:hypothetical protein